MVQPELAEALTLAARAAPATVQGQEDKGQKYPNSVDVSGSDQTQLRGCIAQLQMVIQHKPGNFSKQQLKIRYALNCLGDLALGYIVPHIWEDGTIGLGDLPAFIQHLEVAFGDPDWVAMVGRRIQEIKPKHCEFSQYYAEVPVIADNLDWNPSALKNTLRT